MAGASMNGIKARIKSVRGTMQITKAMELVATSKLRRAKERVERTRPFHEALAEAIADIRAGADGIVSPYFDTRSGGRTCFLVIAGDRGLAGGYNHNLFRLVREHAAADDCYIPVGKKALEYYRHRAQTVLNGSYEYVTPMGVGDCVRLATEVCQRYLAGEFDRVVLVYTRFVSVLSQVPTQEQLLPLTLQAKGEHREYLADEEPEEMLSRIVPEYVAGILYSAVCEATASESGARRTSMSAANKNAGEMIDDLTLRYNRARQAVITQEITEIVSGAQAH